MIIDFTPEENAKVQELIATDFADATEEDMELYARWKTTFELQHDLYRQESEALKAQTEAQREEFERQAQAAYEILQIRKQAALAKLAAVKGV